MLSEEIVGEGCRRGLVVKVVDEDCCCCELFLEFVSRALVIVGWKVRKNL